VSVAFLVDFQDARLGAHGPAYSRAPGTVVLRAGAPVRTAVGAHIAPPGGGAVAPFPAYEVTLVLHIRFSGAVPDAWGIVHGGAPKNRRRRARSGKRLFTILASILYAVGCLLYNGIPAPRAARRTGGQ
jgi:hypothetical protein